MSLYGTPYPIVSHPNGLMRITKNTIKTIKANILVLLLTYPGERVMLPLFGTPLRDLLFEPNDSTLRQQAEAMIADSIGMWLPFLTIVAIDVTSDEDEIDLDVNDLKEDTGTLLGISILFRDPENIQNVQEVKLELPLS